MKENIKRDIIEKLKDNSKVTIDGYNVYIEINTDIEIGKDIDTNLNIYHNLEDDAFREIVGDNNWNSCNSGQVDNRMWRAYFDDDLNNKNKKIMEEFAIVLKHRLRKAINKDVDVFFAFRDYADSNYFTISYGDINYELRISNHKKTSTNPDHNYPEPDLNYGNVNIDEYDDLEYYVEIDDIIIGFKDELQGYL